MKPELVAPAGNFEKLRTAVLYGADSVYLSGELYGLRASSDNFTEEGLAAAVALAHSRHVKVYVTLNGFLHDRDLVGIEDYCRFLESLAVDAIIISDTGTASRVRNVCGIPLHLSTQASCVNSLSARLWRDLGVKRIILGRELSIREAAAVKENASIETEMFIHGSMCMAYSGRCTISNYTAGRDANRGGCVQSCRFGFLPAPSSSEKQVLFENGGMQTQARHFLSSKDLCGLAHVPECCRCGMDALKIEGRMKSPLYAALVVSAYRRAIDAVEACDFEAPPLQELNDLVSRMPHRDYTDASLLKPAGPESVYNNNASTSENASHEFLGLVLAVSPTYILVKTSQKLEEGADIEFLAFDGRMLQCAVRGLQNVIGEAASEVRQESLALLPRIKGVEPHQLVLGKRS